MGQGVEGVYVPGQSLIDVSKNRLFTTSSTNPNKSDSILHTYKRPTFVSLLCVSKHPIIFRLLPV